MIVESNPNLERLARALDMADTAKKKLIIETQDLFCQIGELKNVIAEFGRNKMSLDTQLKDIKRLADDEGCNRAYLCTESRDLSSDCERMNMEEKAQRKNNPLEAFHKVSSEIQLWKDKFKSRASNSIGKTECML